MYFLVQQVPLLFPLLMKILFSSVHTFTQIFYLYLKYFFGVWIGFALNLGINSRTDMFTNIRMFLILNCL